MGLTLLRQPNLSLSRGARVPLHSAGLPASRGLADRPVAVQLQDTTVATWWGSRARPGDVAVLLPGNINATILAWLLTCRLTVALDWHIWLLANDGYNGQPAAQRSTSPGFQTITQPFIAIYDPESSYTPSAELSAQASTVTTALANGAGTAPVSPGGPFDVWYMPSAAVLSANVAAVGPLVSHIGVQAQSAQGNLTTFNATVQSYLAAARSANPNAKLIVQVNLASGVWNCIQALNSLYPIQPDIIAVLTESSEPTAVNDLELFISLLRPSG